MEWLDFNLNEDQPGNYLAVGSMAPIIDIWDVDMVGSLEPEFSLGNIYFNLNIDSTIYDNLMDYLHKGRKKNKKKKIAAVGHTDAVLSLSWNKRVR